MRQRMHEPIMTISKGFSEADARERAYWHSRTPEERLRHLEYLRELNDGPKPPASRLPRIPRVFQRGWG
jgi:hypothetical protein